VSILAKDREVDLKSRNISLKGMLCEGSTELEENAPCRVSIPLGPEAAVEIDGRVVRADASETAVDFLEMDETAFAHLKQLVEHNADDADEIEGELARSAFQE
jgi:hypothetical protein